MNETLWTFVFEVANFVALAALLAWLFFRPVRQALEDQRAAAQRVEDDAKRKLDEAQHMQQQAESQRQALASELDAMREQAREAAGEEKSRILAEAAVQVERERAALKRDMQYIDRDQTSRMALAAAGATNQMVQQLLRQIDGPELEQALVKAACRELRGFGDGQLEPVVVECAATLDDTARQWLDDALGRAAKSVQYRVVPELIGGVRVSTARGLIDASIRGLAGYAETALADQMEGGEPEAAGSPGAQR